MHDKYLRARHVAGGTIIKGVCDNVINAYDSRIG